MNMRWYWAKIGMGAAAIFVVGYAVIGMVRAARHEVVSVVESNADITIPLPFVPFNFGGERVGTFRKLVIHRSDPKHVNSVQLTVRLAEPASLEKFRSCHLTAEDPTRINEHTSFQCVTLDSTMEGFGSLVVQVRAAEGDGWIEAATVPLALPVEVARRIRGQEVEAQVAAFEADRFNRLGDSLGALGLALSRAGSDAERAELEATMEDLRDELHELQEAIRQAARARAEAAVARAAHEMRRSAEAPPPPHTNPKPPGGKP
jgi:hypothetical protein